jgi:hypothetical protein
VETLNSVVDAELEALPAEMRARFVHLARLIEAVGLETMREPHVKHLRGPLWEMRVTGSGWPARSGRPGVHQKDAADARPGNRTGAKASG